MQFTALQHVAAGQARRRAKCRAATLGCVLSLGAAGCGNASAPALLPTPGWNNPNLPLLLRPGGPGELLLRQEGGPVTVWQPGANGGRLVPSDDARWQLGALPVRTCSRGWPPGLEIKEGRATLRGAALALAGTRAFAADMAPGGRWAALLSSSGQGLSLMPFIGAGESTPFHVQFLDLDAGRLVPGAVKLPFKGRIGGLVSCWSSDDRHFLALDPTLKGLVVLTPGLKETM